MTHSGRILLRGLLQQIAVEDSDHGAVNQMLYARSAVYQEVIDARLACVGMCVRQDDGGVRRVVPLTRREAVAQHHARPPARPA